MNHQEIMEKLLPVFAEVFDDEEITITDQTTAEDIEDWDSLTHLQLISTIEEEFEMHFTLGEINNFANVGEMADCIAQHLA